MSEPTSEQKAIIEEKQSSVVIAKPGSGKTFTLAIKIASLLKELPWYKGVIAISYTNKASDELKGRTLAKVTDKKSSFFGTIDKFCLTEIVLPYMRHLYGSPKREIKITSIGSSDLSEEYKKIIGSLIKKNLEKKDLDLIRDRYLEGEVYLELAGSISIFFLENLEQVRRYLSARYTHIFIDEYQDSGSQQHQIFLKLHSLGLIAVAVGDLDQSIYGFAGKNARFLQELSENDSFKKYSLTLNHRCHPSISAYSIKLLSPKTNLEVPQELRVYHKHLTGNEIDIAKWIDKSIPNLKSKFKISHNFQISILVRNNRTAKIICENLKVHQAQLIEETPLDSLHSPLAIFYSDCLRVLFDKKASFNEMLQRHFEVDLPSFRYKSALAKLIGFKREFHQNIKSLQDACQIIIEAGHLIFDKKGSDEASLALLQISTSEEHLRNYFPPEKEKVQILTLHKSKGLEFDAVFHLDLYQYIIPSYPAIVERNAEELVQSLNLHYVGITRAKQVCVLCSSSLRTKPDSTVVEAKVSEFLTNRPALVSLRKVL